MWMTWTTVGGGWMLGMVLWNVEGAAEPVVDPSRETLVEQAYHFDAGTVVVTSRSAAVWQPAAETGIEVIPAVFVQSAVPPAPASPEPPSTLEDATTSEEAPAPPAIPPEPLPIDPEPTATEGRAESASCPPGSADWGRRYRAIYESLPFRRSEYNANPSYRHEATMELLLGQLRPTVIHRGTTQVQVDVARPDAPYAPWSYPARGGFGPYGLGAYGPFAYGPTWVVPQPALAHPGLRIHRTTGLGFTR